MKLLIKETGRIRVIADSAVGRNRRPWFLPESGTGWRYRLALSFRVSKLGKNVRAEFIDRYIDAATLLWIAEADDFEAADYMDGAVVCGEWTDLPDNIPAGELAGFTEYTTIKNGDILAIALPEPSVKLEINQHISIEYNNQEVLNFNIK